MLHSMFLIRSCRWKNWQIVNNNKRLLGRQKYDVPSSSNIERVQYFHRTEWMVKWIISLQFTNPPSSQLGNIKCHEMNYRSYFIKGIQLKAMHVEVGSNIRIFECSNNFQLFEIVRTIFQCSNNFKQFLGRFLVEIWPLKVILRCF